MLAAALAMSALAADAPVEPSLLPPQKAATAPAPSPMVQPTPAPVHSGDRSPPPVIRPRNYKPTPRPASLPGGGSRVLETPCRLQFFQPANWYLLRFENQDSNLPMYSRFVLQNSYLEQIESLAGQNPPPVLKVSGETMVYRGRSFILLDDVAIGGTEAAAAPSPSPRPVRQTPAVMPVSMPADANVAPADDPKPPSSEDVLKDLLRDRPGKHVAVPVLTAQETDNVPSVAPKPATRPVASARGAMVVDRLVRIYPETKDGWWMVNFETDNTLREPPLRLMPCRLLEKAEDYIRDNEALYVRFRVSGEITEYHGRRYLVLRKLLPYKDLGQF